MQNKFPEAEKVIHAELTLQQAIFEKNICPETVRAMWPRAAHCVRISGREATRADPCVRCDLFSLLVRVCSSFQL